MYKNFLFQQKAFKSKVSQLESDRTASLSFCTKMNTKLQNLKKMGKLSFRDLQRKGEKSVLDLGEGYFSASCRRASGVRTASPKFLIIMIILLFRSDVE